MRTDYEHRDLLYAEVRWKETGGIHTVTGINGNKVILDHQWEASVSMVDTDIAPGCTDANGRPGPGEELKVTPTKTGTEIERGGHRWLVRANADGSLHIEHTGASTDKGFRYLPISVEPSSSRNITIRGRHVD